MTVWWATWAAGDFEFANDPNHVLASSAFVVAVCSFILCIKPNAAMEVGKFERRYVMEQLQCTGTTQTCEVLRANLALGPLGGRPAEGEANWPEAGWRRLYKPYLITLLGKKNIGEQSHHGY